MVIINKDMLHISMCTFLCEHKFSIPRSKYQVNVKEYDVWNEVRKTTRLFGYELNQIPYDYTVEVTNRFRGLDLVDRVPEELWMEIHNIVQEAVTKTIPKKKKCKKAKR